jgi:hypothetical protein
VSDPVSDGETANTVSSLTSIVAEFVCSPECPVCGGSGHVCENHPDREWLNSGGCCGGAGMPCPSIAEARRVIGEGP